MAPNTFTPHSDHVPFKRVSFAGNSNASRVSFHGGRVSGFPIRYSSRTVMTSGEWVVVALAVGTVAAAYTGNRTAASWAAYRVLLLFHVGLVAAVAAGSWFAGRRWLPDVSLDRRRAVRRHATPSIAALAAALLPGHDPLGLSEPRRQVYVYAAEVLLALDLVHIRLTMPWLFRGFFEISWPLIVMLVAFIGAGVAGAGGNR